MANIYTYEVLKDTTAKTVIKLTANFDGSGDENNPYRIQANTLSGALDSSKANLLSSTSNTGPLSYYGLSVSRIGYNIASQQKGYVELYWTNGANTAQSVPIMNMDLCGQYSEEQGMVSIQNNANNATGDIGVRTFGMGVIANTAYTLFIELRKDNAMYQRGQLTEPSAFNYGAFGPRP
jgi:hypothetical protein